MSKKMEVSVILIFTKKFAGERFQRNIPKNLNSTLFQMSELFTRLLTISLFQLSVLLPSF